MRRKGKSKMKVLIIVLIILIILGIGGAIGWLFVSKEHREARNLPLNAVDFTKLKDGTYTGEYEGGMYKWRANKVQVTVSSGKVTDIELISPSDPSKNGVPPEELYNRVIESQSLQVDAISGATLTSKAYLQAVENALINTQK
jgi:uncharacterized protein with FMN-binding domain